MRLALKGARIEVKAIDEHLERLVISHSKLQCPLKVVAFKGASALFDTEIDGIEDNGEDAIAGCKTFDDFIIRRRYASGDCDVTLCYFKK